MQDSRPQGFFSLHLLSFRSGLEVSSLLNGGQLREGRHHRDRESDHAHRLLHHDQDQRRRQHARTEKERFKVTIKEKFKVN